MLRLGEKIASSEITPEEVYLERRRFLLGGTALVWGEVYQISAELERQLDEIEAVWPEPSGEYLKRDVAVKLDRASVDAPAQLVCLLYEVVAERAQGKPVIASGDWMQYRAEGAK